MQTAIRFPAGVNTYHKDMRTRRLAMAMVFSGMAALRLPAFHEHGVANCNGCHTIHNSENGQPVDPDHPRGNAYLLIGDSPSDVCLSCHATRFGSVLASNPLLPGPTKGGGNFVFLRSANLNDGPDGATRPISGDAAGHNLNAPGYGLSADATWIASPGGTFPASMLGCTSCHDPHGNQNFRMLYGIGSITTANYTFVNPAPQAVGLSVSDASVETNGSHTAYRSGMNQWCANCHGQFHEDSHSLFRHPFNKDLGSSNIYNAYNLYNGTANPTGGSPSTAYLAAVPFEDAGATTTGTSGPSAGSHVLCLTCHRAHASSGPHSGRWDFNVNYLSEDGVISGSYPLPNPYGGSNQKQLCEKCHYKSS